MVEDKIRTIRKILLENIKTLRSLISLSLDKNKKRQVNYNYKLSKLPKKQQQLVNFQRKFSLTEANYTFLMQKRYEASIAIAATVSDIAVLDKAKDTGQTSAIPKTGFNYAIALLAGLIFPVLIVVSIEVLTNNIQTIEVLDHI